MQTFLPYADFEKSARVLDYRRLGKQRVEARQIYNTLVYGGAWANHPAVLMWKGYEMALLLYGDCMIKEWVSRGYKNGMPLSYEFWLFRAWTVEVNLPPWFGDERLHASHRANLLRKDPDYYGKYGWTEDPTMGYWWPTKEIKR
jgi:hypothetical protein